MSIAIAFQRGVRKECVCGIHISADQVMCGDCCELDLRLEQRRLAIARKNSAFGHLADTDSNVEPRRPVRDPYCSPGYHRIEMDEPLSPRELAALLALGLSTLGVICAAGMSTWWLVREALAVTLRWGWW